MRFSKSILMPCLVLVLGSPPVYAQPANPAPSIPESPAGLASSPAMRVYDGAMTECFKKVTKIDPAEIARKKDKKALDMNPKMFMSIQDCMNDKGIPTNFENYYGGGKPSEKDKAGMSAAQRLDLQAIQDGLDAGKIAAPVAPPAAIVQPVMPVAVPVMPAPVMAPPPVAEPSVAVPEPQKAQTGEGSAPKTPRPTKQYWVKPQ